MPNLDPPTINEDFAASGRNDAKDGSGDLGASCSDQAAETYDLAISYVEADVFEAPGQRQAPDRKGHLADLFGAPPTVVVERSANHAPDDFSIAEARRRRRFDLLAIAKDSDPAADRAHLLEAMRDEDDPGALAQFPPPGVKAGTRAYLNFLSACAVSEPLRLGAPPPAKAILGGAVTQFLHGSPKRGRAIILSDFWESDQDLVAAVARLGTAGFDAAGIHVLAPEEFQPLADGELLVRSVEEPDEVELTATPEMLARYNQELESHRLAVQEVFRRRGGNYLLERADSSIERVLLNTLRQRRWIT